MPPQATPRREAIARILKVSGVSAAVAGAGVWLASRDGPPGAQTVPSVKPRAAVAADPALPELVIARGEDARRTVRRAVEEIGGMRRFVARGDVVALKPNAAWDRAPEHAANTSPAVVAEMVRLCYEAGARRVVVADVSIHEARRVFERSGIGRAARETGAEVVLPRQKLFREVDLKGEALGIWPVLEPFLDADKVINLPVAKHHSLTGASLGLKNWYGILGGERRRLHQRIEDSLADLAAFMRPALTVLDAWRVLLRNGPTGGDPRDAVLRQTIMAATDPVALDAFAAKSFWGLDNLPWLARAERRGLGTARIETVRTRIVTA
jgi:uncharacterized protein (DUF362 family)